MIKGIQFRTRARVWAFVSCTLSLLVAAGAWLVGVPLWIAWLPVLFLVLGLPTWRSLWNTAVVMSESGLVCRYGREVTPEVSWWDVEGFSVETREPPSKLDWLVADDGLLPWVVVANLRGQGEVPLWPTARYNDPRTYFIRRDMDVPMQRMEAERRRHLERARPRLG